MDLVSLVLLFIPSVLSAPTPRLISNCYLYFSTVFQFYLLQRLIINPCAVLVSDTTNCPTNTIKRMKIIQVFSRKIQINAFWILWQFCSYFNFIEVMVPDQPYMKAKNTWNGEKRPTPRSHWFQPYNFGLQIVVLFEGIMGQFMSSKSLNWIIFPSPLYGRFCWVPYVWVVITFFFYFSNVYNRIIY